MSIYLGDTPLADGASTALLAGKADVDLSNSSVPHIVETYVNGTSWYRVWSADSTGNRWCEQGGKVNHTSSGNNYTVTFLKAFANTLYDVQVNGGYTTYTSGGYNYIFNLKTNQVTFVLPNVNGTGCWRACGYIS